MDQIKFCFLLNCLFSLCYAVAPGETAGKGCHLALGCEGFSGSKQRVFKLFLWSSGQLSVP